MKELRRDEFLGQWVIFNSKLKDRVVPFWKEKHYALPHQSSCSFCEHREAETPQETHSYRKKGTEKDAPGWWIRFFENQDAVLNPDEALDRRALGVYDVTSGYGLHEIVVETPEHHTRLEELPFGQVRDVLWAIKDRISAIKKNSEFRDVIVFKNFGLGTVGSMEHSHSQIFATPVTPTRLKAELKQSRLYFADKDRCLWCDMIHQETKDRVRVIFETAEHIAVAPFASLSPYEMTILPKRHQAFIEDMTPEQANDLTKAIVLALKKLAKLLDVPPYTLVLHNGPNMIPRADYWKTIREDYHWHIEISPRLFRLTGLEWGTGMFFNPLFPEEAAEELRNTMIEEE